MIQRPEDLGHIKVSLVFNDLEYRELEIDLEHINKNGRSSFTPQGVAEILKLLLENTFLTPAGSKAFGEEICTYYMYKKRLENEFYKLVICICSDKPNTIGVITLYKESK